MRDALVIVGGIGLTRRSGVGGTARRRPSEIVERPARARTIKLLQRLFAEHSYDWVIVPKCGNEPGYCLRILTLTEREGCPSDNKRSIVFPHDTKEHRQRDIRAFF